MSKPMVSFEVKGAAVLNAILTKMEQKTARNIVTRASRKTLNPTLKEIRSKVASQLDTMGSLSRALYAKQIGISTSRDRQGSVIASIKTANKKVKSSYRKGTVNFRPLAHLFEGGVLPHKIKRTRKKSGKSWIFNHPGIAARPIWANTFDNRADEMAKEFTDNIFEQIKKEWAKKK